MKTNQNNQTTSSDLTGTDTYKSTFWVMSPDDVPVTDLPFATRKEAKAFIPVYYQRFQRQGYYAGRRL